MNQSLNQKGQISILAVLLLPLLISILTGLLLLLIGLKTESRVSAVCRLKIQESQTEVANALNQLLQLNPKAVALQKKKETSQRALELALKSEVPAAIAAASAYDLLVKAEQLTLAAKQQSLIAKARRISTGTTDEAIEAIRSALPSFLQARVGQPEIVARPQFLVLPVQVGTLTPEYKPAPGFRLMQEAKVKWMTPDEFRPMELMGAKASIELSGDAEPTESKLAIRIPSIDLGCSVSLNSVEGSEEKKWEPQITADKL